MFVLFRDERGLNGQFTFNTVYELVDAQILPPFVQALFPAKRICCLAHHALYPCNRWSCSAQPGRSTG